LIHNSKYKVTHARKFINSRISLLWINGEYFLRGTNISKFTVIPHCLQAAPDDLLPCNALLLHIIHIVVQ